MAVASVVYTLYLGVRLVGAVADHQGEPGLLARQLGSDRRHRGGGPQADCGGQPEASHGDVYWEPELFRLSGRLAVAEGAPVEAVTAFERALRLARERGTHLLELRAATDLARLQATQGQPLEVRKVLAPVCDLFADGADMADVQDARAVLAGLDG